MLFVAWFAILVGLAMTALWILLLTTGQVPQVAEGRRDIWFHLGAEGLTAALLVGAGVALLLTSGRTPALLAAVALGALLYTTVNSPGYYADLRQWQMVAVFAALAAATVAATILLIGTMP